MVFALLSVLAIGAWVAWHALGPATDFDEDQVMLYIPSRALSRQTVMDSINRKNVISSPFVFDLMADRAGYWDNIKPGRYEIKKGMSNLTILRMLRNGTQSPVRIVINKVRTREDLAGYLGRQLEADSTEILAFFNSPDSTRLWGLDTNNVLTAIIPNTYSMYWNTPAYKCLHKLYSEREEFWTPARVSKLGETGLTKETAYILASIIEEETNKHDEKPTIASVYLNRLKKNMSLSADPTVKYALRDFKIKRITLKHIRDAANSPYNTYTNKGLPPGPICTPSIRSLDAAISPARTDYLFFCAKADFSGYHSFASNEKDHFTNARAYQRALDSLLIK